MNKRTCVVCGVDKTRSGFYPSSWKTKRNTCRGCMKQRCAAHFQMIQADPIAYAAKQATWKKRHADNRDYSAEYYLRKKYGIELADYNRMFAEQEGVCKMCGDPPGKRRFHVDHCHQTKLIRGLLCTNCNKGIGHFHDDPERCRKAAEYLEASKNQHGHTACRAVC